MARVNPVLVFLINMCSGTGEIGEAQGTMTAGYEFAVMNTLVKFAVLVMHERMVAEEALEWTVLISKREPLDVVL